MAMKEDTLMQYTPESKRKLLKRLYNKACKENDEKTKGLIEWEIRNMPGNKKRTLKSYFEGP